MTIEASKVYQAFTEGFLVAAGLLAASLLAAGLLEAAFVGIASPSASDLIHILKNADPQKNNSLTNSF